MRMNFPGRQVVQPFHVAGRSGTSRIRGLQEHETNQRRRVPFTLVVSYYYPSACTYANLFVPIQECHLLLCCMANCNTYFETSPSPLVPTRAYHLRAGFHLVRLLLRHHEGIRGVDVARGKVIYISG